MRVCVALVTWNLSFVDYFVYSQCWFNVCCVNLSCPSSSRLVSFPCPCLLSSPCCTPAVPLPHPWPSPPHISPGTRPEPTILPLAVMAQHEHECQLFLSVSLITDFFFPHSCCMSSPVPNAWLCTSPVPPPHLCPGPLSPAQPSAPSPTFAPHHMLHLRTWFHTNGP